jgi:hypothetical protein
VIRLLLALALLLPAPAARAILVQGGNGNTSPPADDPGWANVGRIGGLNCVYVGYGWVVTAGHVGTGGGSIAGIDGANYPILVSTLTVIPHDATHDADLVVMRLDPWPEHLPVLEIAPVSPAGGTPVVMIGRGRDRGAPVTGGFSWASTFAKRWGTNAVGGLVNGVPYATLPIDIGPSRTQALVLQFDQAGGPDEGAVTIGDSGGGLFVKPGGEWQLAGIQFALMGTEGYSYFGDDALSVDLSYYRDEILAIARPCDDGLDNDGDTLVDLLDPGCSWIGDVSEEFACNDGYDDDQDGATDHPADPDCASPSDPLEAPDQDGDLVPDDEDNCRLAANATQTDSNQDGFGNACDPDYTNEGLVGTSDYVKLLGAYGSTTGQPHYDPEIESGGDGSIGFSELLLLLGSYGGSPGPSGLGCAGSVPCP